MRLNKNMRIIPKNSALPTQSNYARWLFSSVYCPLIARKLFRRFFPTMKAHSAQWNRHFTLISGFRRIFREFVPFAHRCKLMQAVEGNETVCTHSGGTRQVNKWLGIISSSSGRALFEVETRFLFSLNSQDPLSVLSSLGRIFHFWDTWHGFVPVKNVADIEFFIQVHISWKATLET